MYDNCTCKFMDIGFTKTLKRFQEFMTSYAVPNYVRRYCSALSDNQWKWFYGQMIIALKLTDEPAYLFYVLKWILKQDYDDLAYEMYCQDFLDPECRKESLIKPSRWAECHRKYHDRFMQEYADVWFADADADADVDCAIAMDPELPF